MSVSLSLGSRVRRRWLPWLAPVAAGACVAAGVFAPRAFASDPHPTLPSRTAAQLIAAVQGSGVQALSGTVMVTPALGLPQLPGADGGNQLTTLATEPSSIQVAVDGAARQHLALLGTGKEIDVVRNGDTVWSWDSSTQTATRYVGASDRSGSPAVGDSPTADASPMATARRLLTAMSPSTSVSVGRTARVAGSAVYTLVLSPRTATTLLDRAVIDIAPNGVPLGVAMYARGFTAPAIDEHFTSVSFATPSSSTFRFTPPAGATVVTHRVSAPAAAGHAKPDEGGRPTVIGKGWGAVVAFPAGTGAISGMLSGSAGGSGGHSMSSIFTAATSVVPAGRLLQTRLFTVLFAHNGTVLVGAVPASRLEQVAAATSS